MILDLDGPRVVVIVVFVRDVHDGGDHVCGGLVAERTQKM
jgi:hypothetical protein